MSQPQPPGRPAGRPGRYQRTSGGLVGALLVTLVLVLGFVGIRSMISPDRSDLVREVDWQAQVRAGQSDAKLTIAAPSALPDDWRATSAIYTTGSDPTWQLGLLTEDDRFVGVFERLDSIEDLVEEQVDENAERGDDVEVGGVTWQAWTDGGGDYALAREVDEPVGETGTVLVVGGAGEDVVSRVAAALDYAG